MKCTPVDTKARESHTHSVAVYMRKAAHLGAATAGCRKVVLMELQLADAELLLKLSEHLGGQDSAQDACWPRLSILPQFLSLIHI